MFGRLRFRPSASVSSLTGVEKGLESCIPRVVLWVDHFEVVFKAEWIAYCSHCHLQSLDDFRGSKNGERPVPDNGMVSAPAIRILFGGTPKYNENGKTRNSFVTMGSFLFFFFMILWDPAPYTIRAFKSRQKCLLASCCRSCLPISPNLLGCLKPEVRSIQRPTLTPKRVSFRLSRMAMHSLTYLLSNASELGRREPAAVSLHVSQ